MNVLNLLLNNITYLILAPFKSLHPVVGLTVISVVTGAIMLVIYKYISNQEGIRNVKNKIKANFLEIILFKDDANLPFRAQGRIVLYNCKYLTYAVVPLAVMLIPVCLILIQLNGWYGNRALHPQETILFKFKLKDNRAVMDSSLKVELPAGANMDTPIVRAPATGEVNCRLKATSEINAPVKVSVKSESFELPLVVSDKLTPLSTRKPSNGLLDRLLFPQEKGFPKSSIFESAELKYPEIEIGFLWWKLHWLWVYLILSIAFGLVGSIFFDVEI